ncbi:hypothetical protein IGI04_033225 [Brassica rapa subsp. trilocularis]|uniref:Uncharacterized protein n=2 Tax=Brassica TaxID=3705 RepID=A0ABQ8BUM7_BRANA|nr:uncharacterized protein LOC106362601 [Brassica napus]XP_018510227.1 uncharacterized protein LOC103837247 [Brassica rapa]KAG5381755.1 hypothetical protein IGI04_033225 [Brassica rapa subsp. trilocularis]KAH0908509.1 hypothetical protein HID58_031830 [Brassica napus]
MQNHNSEISSLPPKNPSSNGRRSRGSSHSNEGQTSKPVASSFQMEDSSPRIIFREGCFTSAGYQLLSNRWAAAMHLYNDPTVDVSERPVMYHGGDVLNEAKPLQIQASGKQDITSTKVAK